jgi:phosphopantetheinyl transferase (holo-ACP synthase)
MGMGSAIPDETASLYTMLPDAAEREWAAEKNRVPETLAAKKAVLDALGLDKNNPALWADIQVRLATANRPYIKSWKSVQERAWQSHAVDYNVAFHQSSSDVMCVATAVADIRDISK